MDDTKQKFTKSEYAEHIRVAKQRIDTQMASEATLRQQAKDDRRFLIGDSENGYQWDAQILQQRNKDGKPCLTINKTKNHFSLIVNNARQNPPAARILPVDGGSDPKSAEWMGGLVRNIEAQSQADKAYITAYKNAVAGGEGYWWVDYDYESPDSFGYQIKIREIPDPDTVTMDDNMDPMQKRWGAVYEDMAKEVFKEKYDIDPASWDGATRSAWSSEKDVRVANYFWREDIADTLYLLADGSTAWASDGEVPHERKRKAMRQVWHSWVLGGHEEKPLEESIWPGSYLPIVRIVGDEWVIDGIKHRKGHVRDLKDPARMYNYWSSEATTQVALQNHAPYVGPAEAFAGHEQYWNNANKQATVFLPTNAFKEDGTPIPQPTKQSPAQMSSALVQGMQNAAQEFSMASGQYEAQFGARSNETSGIAINSRKMQSETSTYNFVDEFATAIIYSTRVIVDLIPKLYDAAKVVRILGLDKKESFVEIDPTLEQVSSERQDVMGNITKLFNPALGRYDVVMSSGPSYQTQREAAAASLMDLSRSNPIIQQGIPDILVGTLDFPGADKAAERLRRMLPPNITEGEDDAPNKRMAMMQQQLMQVGQQAQQMQMMLQQQDQALQEAQAAIQEKDQALQQAEQAAYLAQVREQSKGGEVEAKAREQDMRLEAERIKAESAIRVAEINAEAQAQQAIIQAHTQEMAGSKVAPAPESGESHETHEAQETDPALALIAQMMAELAKPRRSIIQITPNADGTYSGEKIETTEEINEAQ